MSQTKAILFDCFGVLYSNALESFYKKHEAFFGRHSKRLDELTRQVNLGRITRDEAYDEFEKLGDITADGLRAEIDRKLVLDEQLVELIKKLKKEYRIGLLSNASKGEIAIIHRDRLDPLFDAAAVSYEVGSVKPEPKIYLVCAQRLGVPPESCVLVDDSKTNLTGAENVGMQTIHYPKFGVIPDDLLALQAKKETQR